MNAPDLSDRFTFTVDPEAEPMDLDDVLADFLIAIYEQPIRATPQPPAATG